MSNQQRSPDDQPNSADPTAWQHFTQPMPTNSPYGPPPSLKRAFWKRGWFIGFISVLVGFAIGSASASGSANDAADVTPTAPPVTLTETISAEAPRTAPERETQTMSPETVEQTTTVTATKKPPLQQPAGGFTMPNEVGVGLQDAQDDIQAVSGNPFFYSDSTDATGEYRFQILDADWQVCSQNPAAGTPSGPNTEVTFAVVKVYESCP